MCMFFLTLDESNPFCPVSYPLDRYNPSAPGDPEKILHILHTLHRWRLGIAGTVGKHQSQPRAGPSPTGLEFGRFGRAPTWTPSNGDRKSVVSGKNGAEVEIRGVA